MAVTTITVQHPNASDFSTAPPLSSVDVLARATGFLVSQGLMASLAQPGMVTATVSQSVATGTITLTGASGVVGAVVAGEYITVEAYGTDEDTAARLAVELNTPRAPVTDCITASATGNVVTLTAKAAGPLGNLVSVAPLGDGVTTSGAFLTGGTPS